MTTQGVGGHGVNRHVDNAGRGQTRRRTQGGDDHDAGCRDGHHANTQLRVN